MAEHKPTVQESRAEEAKSLAAEAMEAERDGDRAEARFLRRAATDLDAEAAAEILRPHGDDA